VNSSLQRAEALHAEGLAACRNMHPAVGTRLLQAALRQLDDGSTQDPLAAQLRGRILVSLAYAQGELGRVDQGWELLAEAEPLLPAERRGLVLYQRGLLLMRNGQDRLALQHYDAAITILREQSDPEDLARALLNRGNVHLNAARVGLARADFLRCIAVASRHGFARILPMATHNLAYVDYLRGDLPAALRGYREVARHYAKSRPGMLPVLAVDKARALTAAGLFREADRELADAGTRFQLQRLGQDYAEAQLARAEAALLGGEPAAATTWARLAHRRFSRRRNTRWTSLASLIGLRAQLAVDGSSITLASKARALVAALQDEGMAEDARVAGLLAVRAFVTAGRLGVARRELEDSGSPRRRDRLDTRLLWRLVSAELAAADGQRSRAARHRIAGLRELERYRSRLGCLDLQTGATVHGRDLATSGLSAAVATGSPSHVYRWSERVRAQALLLPPVQPPPDQEAAAALEELRQVRAALREAELAGRRSNGLQSRSGALQRTIREHSWSATGPGTSAELTPLSEVKTELGAAAMVIYLRDGPDLHALVVLDGAEKLIKLGSYTRAVESVLRLRADLDACAGRAMPRRLAEAVTTAARRDAITLAAAVLDPLLHLLGERDLVIVPTGALVTLPWGVLAACAKRPVTVAPSATVWHSARQRLHAYSQVAAMPPLLVAGPRNERGDSEVRAIAELYPQATVLTGAQATASATLASLDGRRIGHLAAHGRHEQDNALFSSLELADGPLMGYDLQHLGVTPAQIILSSCDLGLSDVRPGDEMLGMTSALLSTGSCTVVASVSRVADETAMQIMTAYHQGLTKGQSPTTALAAASSPDQLAGFVCFGAG
jgi:CHAT domain-containing protein/tetratricopeptide (TPR) repeat protein